MELFNFKSEAQGGEIKKSGPPNRINDMNYTDWMKFQKSFFRELSVENLYREYITFFTKSTIDNRPTRTYLFTPSEGTLIDLQPREILVKRFISVSDIVEALLNESDSVDHILIDFRTLTKEINNDNFLTEGIDGLYAACQRALKAERFMCSIFDLENFNGGGFPIAWTVGMRSRRFLRLKDEKISINENNQRLAYFIISQKLADERSNYSFNKNLAVSSFNGKIPNFTIPKPPPRNPYEILHPAKYPETLVSQFINIFTKKGDWVLDPMLGTGSTVIAAIRERRNSVGIELSGEF